MRVEMETFACTGDDKVIYAVQSRVTRYQPPLLIKDVRRKEWQTVSVRHRYELADGSIVEPIGPNRYEILDTGVTLSRVDPAAAN